MPCMKEKDGFDALDGIGRRGRSIVAWSQNNVHMTGKYPHTYRC